MREREKERVGEMMRQFKKGERDHVNSAERVRVRKRWHVKERLSKKEKMRPRK